MSAKPTVRQTDVSRIVAGAIKGGLPVGSFSVEIGDGIIRLLPIAPGSSVASPAEDGWDKALTQWRRSV